MSIASSPRAAETEIMDRGGYDTREIRGNLADLRFFNRWFGGSRIVAREVGKILRAGGPPPSRLTVLDVASGSADVPAYLARWGAARGIDLMAEGLDVNPDINEEARRYLAGAPGTVRLLRGDALQLPHADRSIDITVCSNFLHHLDGAEAVRALREMSRVSRLGVVAVDLRRGALAFAGVWLLTRLTTRNRLTRHDGPLSVQRAFTPAELVTSAAVAGLTGAVVRIDGPVRMILSWRRP